VTGEASDLMRSTWRFRRAAPSILPDVITDGPASYWADALATTSLPADGWAVVGGAAEAAGGGAAEVATALPEGSTAGSGPVFSGLFPQPAIAVRSVCPTRIPTSLLSGHRSWR